MALVIDLPQTPWSVQNVTLGDTTYIFEYEYSNRYDTWYLSIRSLDNTPLLTGVRLVPWAPILKNHPQETLPAGELVLFDQQSSVNFGSNYPTFDDLVTRYAMRYFTQEELEA